MVKRTGFGVRCWLPSPARPRAGHLVSCKVPNLSSSFSFSVKWVMLNILRIEELICITSPLMRKIWIIRGLPRRTIMRMTWIKICLRHLNWGGHTDGVDMCSVKQNKIAGRQSPVRLRAAERKPWLHWIRSSLRRKMLFYQLFKNKVITWAVRIRVFCIIQWKPSQLTRIGHKWTSSGTDGQSYPRYWTMRFFLHFGLDPGQEGGRSSHSASKRVNISILIQPSAFKCCAARWPILPITATGPSCECRHCEMS